LGILLPETVPLDGVYLLVVWPSWAINGGGSSFRLR
jgi:hypothetical protein